MDTDGLAFLGIHEIQGNAGGNLYIITDTLEIQMQYLGLIGMPLHSAQQYLDILVLYFHIQNGGVKRVLFQIMENLVMIQSDQLCFCAPTVQNGWDFARATQAASRTRTLYATRKCFEFHDVTPKITVCDTPWRSNRYRYALPRPAPHTPQNLIYKQGTDRLCIGNTQNRLAQ